MLFILFPTLFSSNDFGVKVTYGLEIIKHFVLGDDVGLHSKALCQKYLGD